MEVQELFLTMWPDKEKASRIFLVRSHGQGNLWLFCVTAHIIMEKSQCYQIRAFDKQTWRLAGHFTVSDVPQFPQTSYCVSVFSLFNQINIHQMFTPQSDAVRDLGVNELESLYPAPVESFNSTNNKVQRHTALTKEPWPFLLDEEHPTGHRLQFNVYSKLVLRHFIEMMWKQHEFNQCVPSGITLTCWIGWLIPLCVHSCIPH